MDYGNVYYVEDDGRNAARPMVVHQTTGTRLPARVSVAAPPALQYPPQGTYPSAAPVGGWGGYPLYPPYVTAPPPSSSHLATIIGGFGDLGGLANIAAQVFAALLPLPTAPTPMDNVTNESDPATNAQNNSSNLIRYQSALALFARRDQQILTIGSVLKELFKRPGFPAMG